MASTDCWACESLAVTTTRAIVGLTGGIPLLKATIAAVEVLCLRVIVPPPAAAAAAAAAAAPAAASAVAVGAEAPSTAAARPVAAADAAPPPMPQSLRHVADEDAVESTRFHDADAPASSNELPPAFSRGAPGCFNCYSDVPAQWVVIPIVSEAEA